MAALRERLGRVGLWAFGAAAAAFPSAADFARRVERLGVGALWVGGGTADAAALQERREMIAGTQALVVATGILNIWAWEPAPLYAEAAELERAYPGRFLLGLGVSHRPFVEGLGLAYVHPLEAMEQFLDQLDLLERASGAGPAPERVLAALGPKMLDLARERSAGAHPYLSTPDHTARAREVLGATPVLAPEQAVVIDADRAAARRTARKYLATYLVLPNYLNNLVRSGFGDDDFSGGGSDRLVDALVPSGDAEAVAHRVAEHFDAGADHVCIQPLGPGRAVDLDGFRELLGALATESEAGGHGSQLVE